MITEISFLDVPEPLLVFYREHAEQTILCCFNLSDKPQQTILSDVPLGLMASGHGMREGVLQEGKLDLPAWGCVFFNVSKSM